MASFPATSAAAKLSSYSAPSHAPSRGPSKPTTVPFPPRSSPRLPSLVADGRASRLPFATAAAGHRRLMGSLRNTEGLRFGVVVARFNEIVTNLLLKGALETFQRYSVKEENITVVSVPGSFEIPVAAQKLGKSGDVDAILCIGAVIRGDTTHYDAVANSAASGVLSAGLSAGVPCIFGVLTCDDMDQLCVYHRPERSPKVTKKLSITIRHNRSRQSEMCLNVLKEYPSCFFSHDGLSTRL